LNRPLQRIEQTREHFPKSPDLAFTHARLLMAMNRSADARVHWKTVAQYGSDSMRAIAQKMLAATP
jgi:hypothetical protein